MQDQFKVVGRYQSENALRYMAQLCKHFGHKVEARVDGNEGFVDFKSGVARMQAGDGEMIVTLEAPDQETVTALQDVIDRHLERFAFREDVKTVNWDAPAA